MTLVERVAEWPKQWFREGREQGIREVVERLGRVGAEPPPGDALEGVAMTLEERVAEWPKQWLQEGIEHERALLRRMAAPRFGAETAEGVSGALTGIADPEGLAEVGEWLVCCGTGSEFLARVDPVADGANLHDARGNSRPAEIPEEPR